MTKMENFASWFTTISKERTPYAWQLELADSSTCRNRLIRIPTGFGKTLGIFSAWAYHRLVRKDETWPRRLIWCLPMRVLVEQTEGVARDALKSLNLLWDGQSDHSGKVGVHLVMGGADAGDWHLFPEECAVLIGTQDMLLSRALNRGYASGRARWPVEFGILNQDCLWIMDEIQLMDAGLSTSAQIQAFRDQDAPRSLRPCFTWWMSATLQPSWLESVDTKGMMGKLLPPLSITSANRKGPLWEGVYKPCRLQTIANDDELVALITDAFRKYGRGKLTLVILNTVDRACLVHKRLEERLCEELNNAEIRLIHSRFRYAERKTWRDEFLKRDASIPPGGRIIVATQVVEAGVDLNAGLLITELAPWPNLVQRFGRAARDGGEAQVIVVDWTEPHGNGSSPYDSNDLKSSREALHQLRDVAPIHLEKFEESLSDEKKREGLYRRQSHYLLLRHEWDELFDTTPDLTGADIDISRFIRSGDERDLQVFWADVPANSAPNNRLHPSRDALCAIPFYKAQEWLCQSKLESLKDKMDAWVWDWIDGEWRRARRSDMLPGRILLVAARCGGYIASRGWDPSSKEAVPVVGVITVPADQEADASLHSDSLSVRQWKTISVHGADVARMVSRISRTVLGEKSPEAAILDLAARWHDVGKAHPAFQGSIRSKDRPPIQDVAKAPKDAWLPADKRYRTADDADHRPGFRHELAGALYLFQVLRRGKPDHPALRGPWQGWPGATPACEAPAAVPTKEEMEILRLSPKDFDLLVYLVGSHHGKIRLSIHVSPADQTYRDKDGKGLPMWGVREGDVLPRLAIVPGGAELPETTLTLEPAMAGLSPVTGASWTERTIGLQVRHGPTTLAFLEACLRAADVRASKEGDQP